MSDRWNEIRQLFEQVDAVPPEERDEFLARACDGDHAIEAEVRALLAAADASGGVLEPPAAVAQFRSKPDLPERGASIGGYRLGGIIATGGMGVVYEAEQDKPRRRVALKMMRLSFDAPTARRRFDFEAELLARLRHPGIAQIYEAGVHRDAGGTEHPWFAMEFVEDARNLLVYASERQLSLDGRLRLFADICDAVHHGHQRCHLFAG